MDLTAITTPCIIEEIERIGGGTETIGVSGLDTMLDIGMELILAGVTAGAMVGVVHIMDGTHLTMDGATHSMVAGATHTTITGGTTDGVIHMRTTLMAMDTMVVMVGTATVGMVTTGEDPMMVEIQQTMVQEEI